MAARREARRHPTALAVALAAALAVILSACGGGDSDAKALETLDPAVAADRQTIGSPVAVAVIVPDFEAAAGTGDVPRLSVDHYADRWRAEFARLSAEGAMGAWEPTMQVIPWDPLAGIEPLCRAVDDSPAQLMLSVARLPAGAVDCIVAAQDRPLLGLGPYTQAQHARDTYAILPDVARLAAAGILHLTGGVRPAGPVVLVTGDQPRDLIASESIRSTLAGLGLEVSRVAAPSGLGVLAVQEQVAALGAAIAGSSPATVIFSSNTTVAAALGEQLFGPWQLVAIDLDGLTDHWASGRLPDGWLGVPVVSALAPTTIASTPFEDRCRAGFEAFVANELDAAPLAEWPVSTGRNVATTRGALEDSLSPPPDIGYHECTLAEVIASALAQTEPLSEQTAESAGEPAGQAATPSSLFDPARFRTAMASLADLGVARAGRGGFGPDDPTLAHHTLLVELRPADDAACGVVGQNCWTTTSGDRSGLVELAET